MTETTTKPTTPTPTTEAEPTNLLVESEKTEVSAVAVEEGNVDATTITEEDEARIRRKLDLKIIPWVTVMYLLSFLDRVNIGNARVVNSDPKTSVGEFEHDLGLTADQYNWALSIFFVGYVIFEVPSNLLLKRLLPSRWLARIMVSWGICAACLAAVRSWWSLMLVRLLLGIMEAGLFPGVLFYLSFWYRKHELARRMSWFFAAASGAGAFGGLLAFGIARMDNVAGLQGWQWVFLIEGLPTILFGVATWFVLPDFPSTAKFLTHHERKIATERLKKDHVDADEVEFSWAQFKATVGDFKVWCWAFLYFGILVPVYSISFFLPSINRSLGFSSYEAQAMSSPPFLVACIASVSAGFSSDYFKDRSGHLMIGQVVGAVSFFLLAFIRDKWALYVLTMFAAAGAFVSVPTSLSWLTNNMVGSTRGATAVAMMVAFGNIGGAVAGQVYRTIDAPYYQLGHIVNGSLLIFSLAWTVGLRLYLAAKNNKRDKEFPKVDEVVVAGKGGVGEMITEEHPAFRFQL